MAILCRAAKNSLRGTLTENHVAVGEHRLAAKHTADQLAKKKI
jgi:hypothetical protein